MPEIQTSIRYQASTMTPPLKQIAEDYGEYLELLSAAEKLHLLSILALWQGRDTELAEESEAYGFADAVKDYPFQLEGDAIGALFCLEGIEVEQVCDLMVAIANQLREGVFQE